MDALALRAEEGRGIAAISVGEPRAGLEPTISEWGNPTSFGWLPHFVRGAPGELKHLSTPWNRYHSRSSGERTGRCLNRFRVKPAGVADTGLEDQARRAADRQVRRPHTRRRLESVAIDRDSRVENVRLVGPLGS